MNTQYEECKAELHNLRISPESVKILLLLYIKLFLRMNLVFPKLSVFAKIKDETLS